MKSSQKMWVIVLIAGVGLMGTVLWSGTGYTQEKPTAATKPEEAVKVPSGTLDAVTAIMTRRSIRDFTNHPVSEDLIRLLVEAGMCAPSAFNQRSSEFIVISERKILDDIFQLNTKALQIKKAQVAILICGNTTKEKFPGQGYWQLDGSAAAENILVAAHAVGLGAVWTAIYPYEDRMAAVKKLLNIPEKVQPLCIIPIGHPAEKKFRENRFEAARYHQNKW